MELDLDSSEGYFEQLRQMMIFGETWVNPDTNTIRYRPDEHPWAALRPARGKSWTVQWLDEMARAQAAEEERQAMLAELAARALVAAEPEHSPAVIAHWSCQKPTEVLKPFEIVVPDWRRQVEEFAMQDSLLDRYRFPYL